MSWAFYGRSEIAAGASASICTTASLSSFTHIVWPVKIVDGIAVNTNKDFYIYDGPNEVICAFVAAMFGPDGEQIPLGIVAQNTHAKLTYPKNNKGQFVFNLAIPAAGILLPANGTILLYVISGDPKKLNPINL